jgi:ribosomal protein L37AE/L43A
MNADPRERKPWNYPECPSCGIEIYVDYSGTRSTEKTWYCHKCGSLFDDQSEDVEGLTRWADV